MTVIVHHLNNSRSQRVLWLLEELQVPYEVKKYFRDNKTMLAPKELKDVHPLGKSPVITDGADTIAETGAIFEYIVGKYGNGRLLPPEGTPDRQKYTYFLHYAEGTLMTPIILKLIFSTVVQKSPFFIRPIASGISNQVMTGFVQPNIDTNLSFLDSELGQRQWLAGQEFTAADIILSYPIEALTARQGDLASKAPKIQQWLKTIQDRPAYNAALEKGGDFNVLPGAKK